MAKHLPLRKRHYRVIEELGSESKQDLPESGMRRRAVAMTVLQQYTKHPAQPSLVSSANGALEAILFTLPAYVFDDDDNPLWKVYKDLFLKLPAYTQLHMLIPDKPEVLTRLQQWLKANKLLRRSVIHKISPEYKILVWAEDDYEIVLDKADNSTYLIQPHSHRRAADDYAGYFLSRSLGINRLKIPLYFEGGNLLTGDDFFLIGADYLVDSMLDLNGVTDAGSLTFATEKLAGLYRQYLDSEKKLYFVGSTLYIPEAKEHTITIKGRKWTESLHAQNAEGTVQPLFHIDMFLTLAGRNQKGQYQILVGDTRLATRILGEEPESHHIPDAFDDVAELLKRQGFAVIRNPLPLTYVDTVKEKRRRWYYATANNALVEIKSENEKTVWLPTYGYGDWKYLQKTDEANKKIWEELGFTVIMLEDFNPFAEKSGSVHCIKKYLKRG